MFLKFLLRYNSLTIKLTVLFIYLFIGCAGSSLLCGLFSSWGEWGPLFIAVRGHLNLVASLVAEHRL